MAILAGQRVTAAAITLATNPPVFSGYASAAQSIPNNVFTGVQIDTQVIDTALGHSTGTNTDRYVCQVAGLYLLTGLVVFPSGGTATRGAGFSLNGSTTAISGSEVLGPTSSTLATTIAASPVYVSLAFGDYVSLVAFQNTGSAASTSLGIGGARNSFGVQWVSN